MWGNQGLTPRNHMIAKKVKAAGWRIETWPDAISCAGP
jgi:hypothetical protein